MRRRKISLVSLIEDRWIRDGNPALSWEDLIRRTIAADEELEKHGHNPASAFRRHRESKNADQIQRYVRGFYRYPFYPGDLESNLENKTVEPRRNRLPEIAKTQRKDLKEIKAEMDQIHRGMMDILEKLERKKPNEDLAGHITDLEKKGRLPKRISTMMHTLRIERNLVLYENHVPDPHEWSVIENAWAAVRKWSESRRTTSCGFFAQTRRKCVSFTLSSYCTELTNICSG